MTQTGEDALVAGRLERLRTLRELGVEPYPYRYEASHQTLEIRESFEESETSPDEVSLAGRLMTLRDHGKSSFAHLQDSSGRLQLYVRKDRLGEDEYGKFKLMEPGDLVGCRGTVFRTRTGEITLEVKEIKLLAKALRPLPEKWHGLRDPEVRYRKRYLDLLVNEGVREVFIQRAAVFDTVRAYIKDRGFLEVETPILQPLYGGAMARPFETHHHALGMRFFLRIANELYLKRLLVGGMDRVFEFSRDFRNEGMDRTHNPEFTQVELYQAYADYHDMMDLCEGLFEACALAVRGSTEVAFRGQETDLRAPWPRERMVDLVARKLKGAESGNSAAIEDLSRDALAAVALKNGVEVPGDWSWGMILEELYEKLVQPDLLGPVFVTGFPWETSPLAKPGRDDPRWAERFEPVVFGMELGNAFSELNDPVMQERAFREQLRRGAGEDGEGHPLDAEFLRALEHGMPPAGGMGIGMDRLVMILTGQTHIRDVILFPHLRPEADDAGSPEEDTDLPEK